MLFQGILLTHFNKNDEGKCRKSIQKTRKINNFYQKDWGTKIILHFFEDLFYIDIVLSKLVWVLWDYKVKSRKKWNYLEPNERCLNRHLNLRLFCLHILSSRSKLNGVLKLFECESKIRLNSYYDIVSGSLLDF